MSRVDWAAALALRGPQVAAVRERDRDVIVRAGAGSGKTRTLAARYVALLDEGHLPRALAAITFTEKAAREMRNRIRDAIHQWRLGGCPPEDRARWAEIEAEMDTARIGTIHSLCAALLRAHPAEAAVDPRFEVVDEGLAAALQARAVRDALRWAVAQPELTEVFRLYEVGGLERLIGGLMAQPLAAEADPRPRWNAAVVAALQPFATAAAVRAAAADLRALDTAAALLADAGDKLAERIPPVCAALDRLEAALAVGAGVAAALAAYDLRRACVVGSAGPKTSRAKAAVATLRAEYDAAVDDWLGGAQKSDPPPTAALEAAAATATAGLARVAAEAQRRYRAEKAARRALDFDDLEHLAADLLTRPAVRERWQTQIAGLMVDEFQDTNPRQRAIVEALAGVHDGRRGRLFVVGDAKQSIYRFRGAAVAVFRDLDQAVRARGGLPLALDRTYRAHAGLVAAANELLAPLLGPATSTAPLYQVPFAPLEADRPVEAARWPGAAVEFLYGLGPDSEAARTAAAQLLAARLRALHASGVKWSEIALLFRASTGFPVVEAALEAAQVPYVAVAGRGFYDRPEIRDVLNLLRALADPWDDAALAGLLRSPAVGVSDAGLYQLRRPTPEGEPHSLWAALGGELGRLSSADQARAATARAWMEALLGWVDRVSVAELLKQVLDRTRYLAILAAHPKGGRLMRNLNKLLADAHLSGLVRVREFLEYLQTLNDAGAREGEAPASAGEVVTLMTVHKSKGLEYPVIVLADAGRLPHQGGDDALVTEALGLTTRLKSGAPLAHQLARREERAQAEAEAARLAYVAITRAQEKVIICGHQTQRGARAWWDQLCQTAGVDVDRLAARPGEAWEGQLPISGQAIYAVAAAAQPQVETVAAPATPWRPEVDATPLYFPVEGVGRAAEAEPVRRGRVTGRQRHPDGTVVGSLVHEALRRWQFPGDPGCERLLQAAARALHLADEAQLQDSLERARRLLTRLRDDPGWAPLDAAVRQGWARHEAAYQAPGDDGKIDLLYRSEAGVWQVVDFKTDLITTAAEQAEKLEEYRPQLARYRAAVQHLLGATPITTLCWLDAGEKLVWQVVTPDEPAAAV